MNGLPVLLACAILLAGCATGAPDTAAGTGPPGESGGMTSEPTDDAIQPPATSADDDAADAPVTTTEGAYLDYQDGAIEATAGPKALFFHASWCPQCRALEEDLLAQGAPDGLTVFKVDYDSRADLRQKYGVTIQTTIVFVDDAGEKVSSVVLYDEPSVESLAAAIP